MNTLSKISLASILIGVFSSSAFALSAGSINTSSYLHEPLQAEFILNANAQEDVLSSSINLASPAQFKQSGLNFDPIFSDLTVQVDRKKSGSGYRVFISSTKPIYHPVLKLLFEVKTSTTTLLVPVNVLLDAPLAQQIRPMFQVDLPKSVDASLSPNINTSSLAPSLPTPKSSKANSSEPLPPKKRKPIESGSSLLKPIEQTQKIAPSARPVPSSLEARVSALEQSQTKILKSQNDLHSELRKMSAHLEQISQTKKPAPVLPSEDLTSQTRSADLNSGIASSESTAQDLPASSSTESRTEAPFSPSQPEPEASRPLPVQSAPVVQSAPIEPSENSPTFIDSLMANILIILGSIFALLAIGLFLYRRRKNQNNSTVSSYASSSNPSVQDTIGGFPNSEPTLAVPKTSFQAESNTLDKDMEDIRSQIFSDSVPLNLETQSGQTTRGFFESTQTKSDQNPPSISRDSNYTLDFSQTQSSLDESRLVAELTQARLSHTDYSKIFVIDEKYHNEEHLELDLGCIFAAQEQWEEASSAFKNILQDSSKKSLHPEAERLLKLIPKH